MGIVIEIKKYKGKIGPARLKTYAKSAIAQIREMGYFDTLLQLDCPRILLYGVVFDDDGTQIASDELRPAD